MSDARPSGSSVPALARAVDCVFIWPGYLAGVLNQLFGRQAAAPIIVADRRTNSLLIRGRRAEIEAISRLLQRVP